MFTGGIRNDSSQMIVTDLPCFIAGTVFTGGIRNDSVQQSDDCN